MRQGKQEIESIRAQAHTLVVWEEQSEYGIEKDIEEKKKEGVRNSKESATGPYIHGSRGIKQHSTQNRDMQCNYFRQWILHTIKEKMMNEIQKTENIQATHAWVDTQFPKLTKINMCFEEYNGSASKTSKNSP